MSYGFRLSIVMVVVVGCALFTAIAAAADNSGIVVYGQTHRSSPYGSYRSQRRLQVFGPESGFQYQRSQGNIVVQPYGYNGYGAAPRPGYSPFGYGNRGPYGRGFDRFGPGVHAAPQAPFIGDYRHPRHRGHSRHNPVTRGRAPHGSFPRQYAPGQRAIKPHPRAIEPAQRAIGR